MAYEMLFSRVGTHLGNTGIHITPHKFVKGCITLIFDLTPDICASDVHTILTENTNIRIDLKFDEALTVALAILLYQEFDASIQMDRLRKVKTDF